jgi:hypothetical protein
MTVIKIAETMNKYLIGKNSAQTPARKSPRGGIIPLR